MRYLLRRACVAAFAVAASAALSLAGAAAQQKSDASVIRVGVVKVAGHVDVFAAEKLGYFKAEGINVEKVFIRSGAEAQAAVAAGQLEFVGLNTISFILGLHEGFGFFAPVDGFRAPEKDPGTAAILVRSDESVKSAKDLEGKTLGLVSRKGLHHLYLVLWAKKHGVDLAKVRLLEVGYGQMIDTLVSKQVDAVIPLEPIITRGLETGKTKVLAFYDTEIAPGHANGLWVGMKKWVDEHPIAARKFARAVYRAHDYLNKNPDARTKLIAEWTGFKEDFVRKMGADVFTDSMPIDSIKAQVDQMIANGWITKKVDVAKAVWEKVPQ